MPLQLPPLPEFQPTWASFQAWWQQVKEAIERNEEAQQILFDAIDDAISGGDGLTNQTAILGSFSIPTMTITATDVGADVTIAIAAHVRRYGNGTELAVGAGSVTGLSYSTTYGIYYDDPT